MPVPIAVAPRLISRISALSSPQPLLVLLHASVEAVEFLAQRHRHGVLQLGAAHLQHVGEFLAPSP